MGWPPLPSIHAAHLPNGFSSAWPASSNQNADDMSDAGFFHTGVVLYLKSCLLQNETFSGKLN